MLVYYSTLALTALFGCLANWVDFPHKEKLQTVRCKHSGMSLFFFILALAVLIFVAGFRYYVGSDYGAAYNGYSKAGDQFYEALITLNEPVYYGLMLAVRETVDNGAVAVFLLAALTIVIYMTGIYRNSKNIALALVLFVLLGCWDGLMNGYRQPLAAAIVVCGYPYIRDRDFKKYCIIIAIAFLCHRSAILMLVLYFAVDKSFSRTRVIATLAITVAAIFAVGPIFDLTGWLLDDPVDETNTYVATQVNALRILAACAPAVLFFILYWGNKKNGEVSQCLYITMVHACLSVATSFSAYIARMTIYTTPFLIYAIPALLAPLPAKARRPLTAVILILYLVFWSYELSHSSGYLPFNWIWNS